MAAVRTFVVPHYETYPVHVAAFRDVANSAFLRTQLLDANPAFDYAFLDAEMILSQTHLLSTSFLALHAFRSHRHKTRTPHSELVFRLSPNNNIGESYKRFGIADDTSTIIAVKLPVRTVSGMTSETASGVELDLAVTAESVGKHLGEVVQGTSVPIGELGEELGQWCDLEKVRKVYKLPSSDAKGKKGKKGDVMNGGVPARDEKKEVESVVLGIIALKGS